MGKNSKTLIIINLLLIITVEGRLDITCTDGKIQEVDISSHAYGNVYSPGYTEGKPRPNSMNCTVFLSAQDGKHIRLTFNRIDILASSLCLRDRLVINFPGNNLLIPAGLYCGNLTVPDYVSPSNKIIISFLSSHFGTGSGFNVTYRQVSSEAICLPGEFQCRNMKCVSDRGVRCNGTDECGDGTDEEDCDYPVPAPSKCGVPEVEPFTGNAIVDRVVGGHEAVRGSWPWQADLQVATFFPNGHVCGGSLITPQWLITAGHCIQPFRQTFLTRVVLGNHHKYKKDPYEQIRYMKDFFVYGFEKEEFFKIADTGQYFLLPHDLALVKLNAPVLLNPHVQVVCLPQLGEELKPGKECFSTGWGMTRGSGHEDVLKQAEYPIQNAVKCNVTELIKFVEKTMICAGSLKPLNGLCHGDSGGPLVCKKDGKWHVYGATSFLTDTNFIGGLCGLANVPTSFSKISVIVDWIDDIIANNS